MEFEFENVLVNGEKKYKLVAAKCRAYYDLPYEYINGYPKVFTNNSHDYFTFSNGMNGGVIHMNDLISIEQLEHFMNIAKEAGNRLYEIDKRVAELQRSWAGKHLIYKF